MDLKKIQFILQKAISLGINTRYTYIVGLDSYDCAVQKTKEMMPYTTDIPIVQIFQNYITEHSKLRHKDSLNFEYYLKLRANFSYIFKKQGFVFKPWENYRSLWYQKL